jgi:DNA primase
VERLFHSKDLGLTDDFQQVSRDLAALFSELPDSIGRSQYIHRIAGRLSQGNGRLAVQLEEDFRRRTRVRAKPKEQQPAKIQTLAVSTRQKAEAQLLAIFIEVPSLRELIRQAMAEYKIEFIVSEYRNLWDVLTARVQPEETQPEVIFDFNCEEIQNLLQLADPFTLSRPKELFEATIQYFLSAECERRCIEIGQLCDDAESQGDWEKVKLLMEQRQAEMEEAVQIRNLAKTKMAS